MISSALRSHLQSMQLRI